MLPIILTKKQKILIIGAGNAAIIKLKTLKENNHKITILSKEFPQNLNEFNFKKKTGDFYELKIDFFKKFDLIYLAIPIEERKSFIKKINKIKEKKLINVLADHALGNFIHPCTRKNDNFMVSVSTYGKNPKKARLLCEKFAKSDEN